MNYFLFLSISSTIQSVFKPRYLYCTHYDVIKYTIHDNIITLYFIIFASCVHPLLQIYAQYDRWVAQCPSALNCEIINIGRTHEGVSQIVFKVRVQ